MMRTFRFGTNGSGGRVWMAAVAMLTALAMLVQGCREPVTTYHVAGAKLNGAEKVLVLPFLDTRTFADPNDPFRDSLGTHARDIFAAAMVEKRNGDDTLILTPDMPRQEGSLSIAQIAELGRQHGADVVVAGQIFSFTETRAASIPPRAGMFIRVVSAKDGNLLFVGDHYMSAAVPGAPGGRELQARNVTNRLLDGLVETAKPLAQAAVRVASYSAFANLSTETERAATLPGDGENGKPDNNGPVLEFSRRVNVNYQEWGDQPVPELPPILDLGEELYSMPPPALEEEVAVAEETETAAPESNAVVNAAVADAEHDAAKDDALAAKRSEETPDIEEAAHTVDGEVETAEADKREESADDIAVASTDNDEEIAELLSKPLEVVETAAVDAAAETDDTVESTGADEAEIATVPAPAPVSDASDDQDVADASDAETDSDESMTDLPSGDELAEDLFEPDMEEIQAMREPAGSDSDKANESKDVDKTSVRLEETTTTQPAVNDGETPPAEARDTQADESEPPPAEAKAERVDENEVETEAAATSGEEIPSLTQMAYIDAFRYPDGTAAIAEPMPAVEVVGTEETALPAPVADVADVSDDTIFEAAPARYDEGPIVSVPLAVEQPRPVRLVDMVELPADPDAALVASGPAVSAPALAATASGAPRILMLPYHDRENPNNLIPNTGGGEVVTTLYGTQLALDPGIQLMWDSSGQVSHDRLVTIDEALALGRMVGADYVVRGQVVEFRRAQSVPSFYSVIISTAVLAAQIVFAEMSGVDVATEVYRVSDGRCVMSRRDRAQQKYVVQAEKTVRRLAAGMAAGVVKVVKEDDPETMDPLIDELSPVTVLSNPR